MSYLSAAIMFLVCLPYCVRVLKGRIAHQNGWTVKMTCFTCTQAEGKYHSDAQLCKHLISTGKPKGMVHSQAGYLLYTSITHEYVFDYRPHEVFACVADIGYVIRSFDVLSIISWITGHSYIIYGPLANGATTVMFESTPLYPDAGRYWYRYPESQC